MFKKSILNEKEETLNEELEVGSQIFDKVSKKLRIALQTKGLTAVFVAQAMIEAAHNKIKCANTDIVLNLKKPLKNCWEKTVSN